jgi:hypothetical protein
MSEINQPPEGIRQVSFKYSSRYWVALFEGSYIDTVGRHGGAHDRTPENFRITWSIRRVRRGWQDLCLSGHWSEARGVYSVDRMEDPAPRGLIQAAFKRRGDATPVEKTTPARCCQGVVVSRDGRVSGSFCAICRVLKVQNANVLAGIAARRKRLFDGDIADDAA